MKRSIGQCLSYWSERLGDSPAISDSDETISWSELDRSTNRLARHFEKLGVGEDDFVTITLRNGIPFYKAAFAAWKLGATVLPISYRMPAIEREALLELVRPELVVDDDYSAASTEESDASLPDRVPYHWKAVASGGSTGRPKVIVNTEAGAFDPTVAPYTMIPGGAQLVVGPLYHNASLMFSTRGLLAGKRIVVMPRFDAEATLAAIERERIDWVVMVPTMMQRIYKLPDEVRGRYDVSSLSTVLHTASKCPEWLKEAWINWVGAETVQEIYGGTEGCGTCWISGTEWLTKRGSVGRPMEGFRMKVVDSDGNEVPRGTVGDIRMLPDAGPGSTYFYIGSEANRDADGWEWIGDMGYQDEDDYIFLSDRRTDLVIVGGANVYPAEVEAAIDRFEGVRSNAVIGIPDDDLGARLHAIIDAPGGIDEEALLAHLREQLVSYKLPRSFEYVHSPVRDEAGKVRRAALRAERVE